MNLKEDIKELPKAIMDAEMKLLDDKSLLEENKLIIDTARVMILSEIERENEIAKEANMKPLWPNAEKRDKEAQNRMDNKFSEIITSIKNNTKKIRIAEIELDYLKRQFRMMESLLRGGDQNGNEMQ